MMLMLVVRYVALYCISIVTNPPLVSRPVPVQVWLEVLLDFQAASKVRLAASGLEVETTIQRDLLALILPSGMRRDTRTSASPVFSCKWFFSGKTAHTKNRDGRARDQLKEYL